MNEPSTDTSQILDAFTQRRDDLILVAVQQGLDPDAILNGASLLSLACASERWPLVRGLLVLGANPSGADKEDMAPLHWAINKNTLPMATLLLEQGADIERKDRHYERSPLWNAAAKCGEAMVRMLVDRGADLLSRDREGAYPLHGAVLYENPSGARALAPLMTTVDVRDAQGITPLQLAIALLEESAPDGPLPEIAAILREHGANAEAEIVPDEAFRRAQYSRIVANMKAAAPGWEPSAEQIEAGFREMYPQAD
ncbi:MAG: ankyrin repeat domain-containing protein [Deltaproteobacteria bacterium]|nr:ankyrin repeat domain-containing protein [Deltaproteobacteria bacterium]